jgi:predicted dehydrogenase
MAKLKMGMVGGGKDAFIGAVHRMAAALDGQIDFVAGALSSTPEKARASGLELGLSGNRAYGTWEEMLDGELALPEGERIDFVSVVTPNHMHFPVAHAFASAGFNVVSDKPLVHTSEQADQLIEAVTKAGVVFAVTYNYSGYPMVKEARHLVASGQLGNVRKVIVEYNQGWLASEVANKQADWRTDPARSGVAGAIGDIGSHAEQLVSYVTGLELDSLCADLTAFVPGRQLDDDGNLLLRFEGGAKGVLIASQISSGEENGLRLRVYGEQGGARVVSRGTDDASFQTQRRARAGTQTRKRLSLDAAKNATRIPAGHPEAFLEAFANVYRGAAAAMRARKEGGQVPTDAPDFPTVYDGARGVHFIEKTVQSSRSSEKWTEARWRRP